MSFADLLVLALLGAGVFLAVRSLAKEKKKGGGCAGCSGCSGCSHSGECSKKDSPEE